MQKQFDPKSYTEEAREVWDKTSRLYDEKIASRFFQNLANETISWASPKSEERILDVACGAGIATLETAQRVKADITAVDLSPEMIRLAGNKAEAAGFKNIRFEEMNAEALKFQDQSFDLVICQLGLMLFADPKAALNEMFRVLKSGGRAVAAVQGTAEKMVFTSAIQKAVIKRAPHLKIPGAPVMYAFGPEEVLENAFKEAGFTRVETKRLQGAFPFKDFEDYWDTVTSGAGKTKTMLLSLSAEDQKGVENEVRALAETFRKNGGVEIPYEFTLARGVK